MIKRDKLRETIAIEATTGSETMEALRRELFEAAKTFDVFWKRGGKWAKVNKTPMKFSDASTLVDECNKSGIGSVTSVELLENIKEWQ